MEGDVLLKGDKNNSCSVHLFGATITSWICGGKEMIFVSSKSYFDKKRAIRGGIPVIFPNFGPWEAGPQHGFARTAQWSVLKPATTSADGQATVSLCLDDNEDSRKLWNYRFKLIYTITLTHSSLKTALTIQNTGTNEFDFTCLLHTYFNVPDIKDVKISDLKGVDYIDKVRNGETHREERQHVTISENVDSVYISTQDKHMLFGAANGKKVAIQKFGFPDTVVWNPWKEKAVAMADFGDDEYLRMVCVEAGHVAERKHLLPGQTVEMGQTLTVID